MDLLIDNRLGNGGWLLDRVNGLFDGLASEFEPISPPVDVVEDHDGYRFSIDLPGLKSDSLEVKVEDETLVINAERNEPALAKTRGSQGRTPLRPNPSGLQASERCKSRRNQGRV
jgi:HSP20 family molecular chaperone IbpA